MICVLCSFEIRTRYAYTVIRLDSIGGGVDKINLCSAHATSTTYTNRLAWGGIDWTPVALPYVEAEK